MFYNCVCVCVSVTALHARRLASIPTPFALSLSLIFARVRTSVPERYEKTCSAHVEVGESSRAFAEFLVSLFGKYLRNNVNKRTNLRSVSIVLV